MKIWKGEEQEGKDKGIMTLFVQQHSLTKYAIKTIMNYQQQTGIKRLYLGAGRRDVLYYDKEDIELLVRNSSEVIIECTYDNYKLLNNFLKQNCSIIVSFRILPDYLKNIIDERTIIKIDDYSTYALINNFLDVRKLDDVIDNKYDEIDELIYNDEEEEV